MNPADLPSRGCNPKRYLESRWWEGPSWLYETQDKWPKSDINELNIDEDIVNIEEKKNVMVNIDCNITPFSENLLYFSQYKKIIRMLAYILRCNTKRRLHNFTKNYISGEEFLKAEQIMIQLLQKEYVNGKELKNLCVIKD